MTNQWRAYLLDRMKLVGTALVAYPIFCFGILVLMGVGSCTVGVMEGPSIPIRWNIRKFTGIFADDTIRLTVWHQHPGPLRNGNLRVTARGQGWGPLAREWSFEEWQPNSDAARTLDWKLTREQLLNDVTIHIEADARGVAKYVAEYRLPPDAPAFAIKATP